PGTGRLLVLDDSVDGQCCAAECVAVAVEAEEGIRCVCGDVEFFYVQGVDGDDVAVCSVACWWCGTDASGATAVVSELECAGGQTGSVVSPSILSQFRDICRDVAD